MPVPRYLEQELLTSYYLYHAGYRFDAKEMLNSVVDQTVTEEGYSAVKINPTSKERKEARLAERYNWHQ